MIKTDPPDAFENFPFDGRHGRVSTGRGGEQPCRTRAVESRKKLPTERARHPCDGCRRTVATGTGGSPKRI
jgi:hypothetical protein